MALSKLGRAAIAYAERLGWPVFPCQHRGKFPIGGHGHCDATTDIRRIEKWWTERPTANIGLACDARSGLLAVDIDPRHGGDDSLAELEATHGELPHTIEALTGGGGRHLLYKRPQGVNFRGKLGPGIDIKANGYIIVAPSIHQSGGQYRWEACGHPLETELAELPNWALQRILNHDHASIYGQPADDCARSFLALAFHHAGWLGKRIDSHRINVRCPWEDQHTTVSGSGGTIIFAPRHGSAAGWFHCSHESHGRKTMREVMEALPYNAIQQASADIAAECADDAIHEAEERAAIQAEGTK